MSGINQESVSNILSFRRYISVRGFHSQKTPFLIFLNDILFVDVRNNEHCQILQRALNSVPNLVFPKMKWQPNPLRPSCSHIAVKSTPCSLTTQMKHNATPRRHYIDSYFGLGLNINIISSEASLTLGLVCRTLKHGER